MIALEKTSRQELFGVEVDALTMDETVDRIMDLVEHGVQVQHVVLNAAKVVMMSKDPKLLEVIRACPVVNADGQSVVTASRLLGRPLPERVAGIDLFAELVARAADNGRRVYFLGARDEILEEMVSRFRAQHPTLRIAGYRNGYWSSDHEVIAQVNSAQPDLLFLAIPSPRKEFWLAEHLPALGVPFAMGVGGSFDVIAGKVKRAPAWVQRIGCEWVYRLVQEPRRMWKRYLVGNSSFMWLTFKELRKAR
ncbi:MAG TPA: WecB/TagA/CpsF family glycosyltransferase [Ilumatobacteraceae bacterium]|jgi:N-acetylglucosaminyldiphosphoundecaprenol N-acetyl-beta-D-mannosaminyltransferase